MGLTVTRTRKTAYQILWKAAGAGSAYDFGGVDKITPNLTLMLEDIRVGTTGRVILGKRIVGLEGTISSELREADLTAAQKLSPWFTSGPLALSPATYNKDLYDYAGLLTLHPVDMGADVTQDLNLLKAAPVWTPFSADGNTDNKITAEWFPFPDRTQLPVLNWGYMGTPP